MPAYGSQDTAVAGLTSGMQKTVMSRLAAVALAFGVPLFVRLGEAVKVFGFVADRVKLTFSADLAASNSTTITVNGVATVAEVYASSHAATFAAIVAKVEALAGVDVVSSSATTREIIVQTAGLTCAASGAVTGGSAVTVASAFPGSTSATLRGVAAFTQKGVAGSSNYAIGDAVNTLTEGQVYVPTADAVQANAPAYLTSAGAWTDEASGNMATPYYFRTGTSGAGLALLDVIQKAAA